MKQVKLHSMTLRNFKGVKEFTLVADGANTEVHGANATGKTTLPDAFYWVLFDKDSQNKKDFAIETLNVDGQEILGMDNEVELTLLVDGISTTFKKVHRETYETNRNKVDKTFKGHTNKYHVNDVPMAKKDYDKKVHEIIDEDTFKLLTSPTYFNEVLKWPQRREAIIPIAGDVTDEEVIASKATLGKLPSLMQGKTIEERKAMIASRVTHINKELKEIPARIDEVRKMMPEELVDVSKVKADIAHLDAEIDGLKNQRYNITNGAALQEKRNQQQDLAHRITSYQRDFSGLHSETVQKLRVSVQSAEGDLQIVTGRFQQQQFTINSKQQEITRLQPEVARHQARRDELREQYFALRDEPFEYTDACECPTCNQSLPADKLEAARAEALAQFNSSKSLSLAHINSDGELAKEEQEQIEHKIHTIQQELVNLNERINIAQSEVDLKQKVLDKVKRQLDAAVAQAPVIENDAQYQALLAEQNTLAQAIVQLTSHAQDAVQGIDEEIQRFEASKRVLNTDLGQLALVEANEKRIAELENLQINYGMEYEKLNEETHLIEEFIRTKVDMLNEKIDEHFELARFKMFDTQNNGVLNECCETMYEGVPYSTGLNNAARINVGLDICATLQKHHGIQLPIWVDNRESVSQLFSVEAQTISLLVSEKDKQLRVETSENELAEAI